MKHSMEFEVTKESLAEFAHKQWTGWMNYLFEKCEINSEGHTIIPVSLVERWKRQCAVSYAELSELEKDNDRKEAIEMIQIFELNKSQDCFDDFFGTPIIFDKDGEIAYVIGIVSISGGANEKNGMPLELSLLKRDSDGKETRANYIQEELLDPIKPGEILKEDFMDKLSISINKLSRDLFISRNRISGIIKGECDITADIALRLEKYFGVSAEFWLNLQKDYDLRIAKKNTSDLDIERIIPFERRE